MGGERGNAHGSANEDDIASMLERILALSRVSLDRRGFGVIEEIEDSSRETLPDCGGVYATEVTLCISNIVERGLREDFLVHKKGWPTPLAISAKHQQGPGSTWERIEAIYANIAEQKYPCPVVLVLEGDQLKGGVLERARRKLAASKGAGRLALVFDGIGAFRRWLTDGAAYPEEIQQPPTLPGMEGIAS